MQIYLEKKIPQEEQDRIYNYFKTLDKDGQGFVSMEAFQDSKTMEGIDFDYYDLNGKILKTYIVYKSQNNKQLMIQIFCMTIIISR